MYVYIKTDMCIQKYTCMHMSTEKQVYKDILQTTDKGDSLR